MSRELDTAIEDVLWQYADILHRHGLTSIVGDPREVGDRIGRALIREVGNPFRIGRHILTLVAPDGYLLPPLELRFFRQDVSCRRDDLLPLVTPWSVTLWQSGHVPARWEIGGTVIWPDGSVGRGWWRLLHLTEDRTRARTDEGWLRLGTRMHS
ncbi:hypothetical protein ASG25_21125 [Rhizobium sp. Leaf384]|uniref:hypothetical protein n=1 Tax=unclassified Rhizobium TaxID=2613769 RepID=UPI0007123C5A|nr:MULTISPECIES: hypothetical protein [unclassified Rhizobium]KQS74301.1 hypothetical protein ASG25_21125 [Rhizobium sp. Leaf384]KQS83944.1 hypothetical protein ASG58_21505 [Rhizobium sp. Leaf383]